MSERESRIVNAAIKVFLQYGVKKATMNDIALEAGMVRQTLYNIYAGKNELLRAVIVYNAKQTVAELTERIPAQSTLAAKLDLYFEVLVLNVFDMVHASPHGKDLFNAVNNTHGEALAEAGDIYTQCMVELLKSHARAFEAAGHNTAQVADCVFQAAKAFKMNVSDRARLQTLLATLRTMVLQIAGEPLLPPRSTLAHSTSG